MDKKKIAMTLLLQAKDIEKKIKEMVINYGKRFPYNVSAGVDDAERKNMLNDIKIMKKQVEDKKKLSQQIINTIKKEEKEQQKNMKKQEKKVDNTPIKPTGNVYQQVNDIAGNTPLYIK